MRETRVTLPELGLVAGTRVALGAGIGLLIADRLTADQRRGAGWALFAVGLLTTIPLALEILGKERHSPPDAGTRSPRRRETPADNYAGYSSAELESMAHA
jgi:hypothetical protein